MTSPSKGLSGKRPDAVRMTLDDEARDSFKSGGVAAAKAATLPWVNDEVLAAEAEDKSKKSPVFIRLSPMEKAKLDYLREHAGINVQQFGKRVLMAAVDAELSRIVGKE